MIDLDKLPPNDRDVLEPFILRTLQRVREKHGPAITLADITISVEVRVPCAAADVDPLNHARLAILRRLSEMDAEGVVI